MKIIREGFNSSKTHGRSWQIECKCCGCIYEIKGEDFISFAWSDSFPIMSGTSVCPCCCKRNETFVYNRELTSEEDAEP